MKRFHALLLALLFAAAAVAGTVAVVRTTSLGLSAKSSTAGIYPSKLAARNAHLDKTEAALHRALRKKPPALPKLPKRHTPRPHVVHVVSSAPSAQPVAAVSPPVSAPAPSAGGGGGSGGAGSTNDDNAGDQESEPEPEGGDDGP